MILAAADPGKTGALVVVNSETGLGHYHCLEYDKSGLLLAGSIQSLLDETKPKRVYLEKVGGRDGWSATASFGLGLYYGQLRYVLANSGRPHQLVGPKTWQKVAHEGVDGKLKPKERSFIAYTNLFPSPPVPHGPRGGKPHDGCVDCILMLVFAFQKYGIIPDDWRLEKWMI